MADQLLDPKTVGALLAEEWSINPLSTLPSFLEMKFIEDASTSGHTAIKSIIQMLTERLQHYSNQNVGILLPFRDIPKTFSFATWAVSVW